MEMHYYQDTRVAGLVRVSEYHLPDFYQRALEVKPCAPQLVSYDLNGEHVVRVADSATRLVDLISILGDVEWYTKALHDAKRSCSIEYNQQHLGDANRSAEWLARHLRHCDIKYLASVQRFNLATDSDKKAIAYLKNLGINV